MGLKDYFDNGLKSTLAYAVLGVAAGYVSFLLNNPRMALATAIIVLILSSFALKTLLKTNYKWLLNNGIMVFVFVWFIVWTIFYNLAIA